MARKTKEDAEKTREQIIQAAECLFCERGVVRTSLHEIAATAGVTRGAVYWHFKDKDDLVCAIADGVFMLHEALLDRMVEQESANPLALLQENCCLTLNAITNDPRRRRVFTILTQRCECGAEMAALHKRNDACRERLRDRVTALFKQVEKKNQLAPAWTPQTAAFALQSMIIGFIDVEMEYDKPSRKRDKMRNEALASFFKALKKAP